MKELMPEEEKKESNIDSLVLPCQISGNVYFHCKVLIRCQRSCFKKSFTIPIESSFGVAAKYNAPLKKCFVESVRKN